MATLTPSGKTVPAVAFCLWDDNAAAYLSWTITVLTLGSDHIAEITSFIGPDHFTPCGLPASLP